MLKIVKSNSDGNLYKLLKRFVAEFKNALNQQEMPIFGKWTKKKFKNFKKIAKNLINGNSEKLN